MLETTEKVATAEYFDLLALDNQLLAATPLKIVNFVAETWRQCNFQATFELTNFSPTEKTIASNGNTLRGHQTEFRLLYVND